MVKVKMVDIDAFKLIVKKISRSKQHTIVSLKVTPIHYVIEYLYGKNYIIVY